MLGSNGFDAFAVTGVSALVGPLRVPDSLLELALPLMVIAALLGCFTIMKKRSCFTMMEKKMTRREGWPSLLSYAFLLGTLFDLV